MRIAIATGQRAQALAQYEQCKAILDEEMGAETIGENPTTRCRYPTKQTDHLSHRLHNFRRRSSNFVGRDAGIARLVARLHDPQNAPDHPHGCLAVWAKHVYRLKRYGTQRSNSRRA